MKLIEGLANVDPARSQLQANPVMRAFWFTGKRLMAYNGTMALSVAMPSEFVGAVQDTVFPLLNSSQAPECSFEETEKGVTVKAGAAKFKLLTIAAEEFNFSMPKFPEDRSFPVVDVPKFLMGVKACKRSLGSETSEAAFKGITMIAGKNTLNMFAYDRLTLTHAIAKTKGEVGFDRVVVPTSVIDQLIRITEGATELDLAIDDKRLLARCNGVTLWGQIEDEERTQRPFMDQSKDLAAGATSTIDITDKDFAKKFPSMLQRACIITQDTVESSKTKVTVSGNKIFFHSKSTRGVVDDAIMPGKGQSHGDVELKLDPRRVIDALDLGSLSFTPDATILTNHDRSISYYVSGD
jgi:hypothetical protein